MAFTLKSLAGMLGLEGEPDETTVVQALTRRLDAGSQAAKSIEGMTALSTERDQLRGELAEAKKGAGTLEALTTERDKLRADLQAAQKVLAEAPAPVEVPEVPAAKYKAGDKVMYRGA